MPRRPGTRRLLRVVGRVLAALGLLATFLAATLAGLLLHLDLPAGRRLAARALSQLLGDLFQGTVTIGRFDDIDLSSVTASNIEVHDPQGKLVLEVSELRAKADLPAIAEEVLWGGQKLDIVIPHVRIEKAEGNILPDPVTGVPSIAAAFTPVVRPSKPGAKPSGPPRQIRVWLPHIEIGRAYARGTVAGLPTLEAELAQVTGSVLATQKGVAVDVSRFGTVVRGLAGTDARGTGTLHIREPGAVWTSFDGYFGNVEFGAFTRVDENRITATLDLPRARPAAMRALWPDWPLKQDTTAHLEARGKLPDLQTSATFNVEGSQITAKGPLHLAGTVGAKLEVKGRHANIQALWPKAPATDISADASLDIWNKNGQVVVDVNGTTQPTRIADQPVPAVDLTGTFNEKGFDGKATLHEHGLPLKVAFSLHPDGAIDLDARSSGFSIQGAPRLRQYTDAQGRAQMRVKARIEHEHLDAYLTADVNDFALGDVKLEHGQLNGHASGPLTKPDKLDINAQLSGRDMTAGMFSFDKVDASARGPVVAPHVTASLKDRFGPSVDASATVPTRGPTRIRQLSLEVKRGSAKLHGKVARLDLAKGNIEVKDLALSGTGGEVHGSARIRPSSLEIHADGTGLDLDEITQALGLPRGTVGGRLGIHADVVSNKKTSNGQVRIALGHASIMNFGGISMLVNAKLDDGNLDGDASVLVKDIGALGAQWETTLAGPVQKVSSWRDVIGQAQLQFSDVNLAGLEHALPKSLHVDKVTGRAFGQLRIDRKVAAALPSLFAVAGTKGLDVVRSVPDSKPERIQGVDVQVGGQINGETGDTNGTIRLIYENTVLAAASGTLSVDLQRAVRAPGKLAEQLLQTPITAVLSVPDRGLDALPAPLRPRGVSAVVGGRISVEGTLRSPTFSAHATARRVSFTTSRYAMPFDLDMTAQYVQKTGRFGGTTQVLAGDQRLALLTAQGTARWEDLFGDVPENKPRWTGGVQLLLNGLPLRLLPPLADSHVAGELYGSAALQRQSLLPQVAANVDVKRANIDMIPVGEGRATVRSNGEALSATLHFDHKAGSLDAQAHAALAWQGVVPSIDDKRPVRIDVDAKHFDAVVLSPLLSDVFSELSGDIDAQLSAVLSQEPDPEHPKKKRWTGQLSGKADMQHGVLQIAALGMRLSDVAFTATATGRGRRTVIVVPRATAKSRSDQRNIAASARLYMDGLRLDRGAAAVNLGAGQNGVPLMTEGVQLASVTSKVPVTVTLHRLPQRMIVDVEVPDAVAKLPRATSQNVISLDDNPDIQVLQPLGEPVEHRSEQALPWHIIVNLGTVRVIRNDIEVPIDGQPIVDIGEKAEVKGYISLQPGGRVPALGKVFIVDGGRVTFDTGDSSNPHVDATASWRSPEGTTVYAKLQGTVKDAKLRLSSDPAMPESEIMALLLGGPSSQGGTETGSRGQQAQAIGVGAAALGFNELFSETPLGAVQFRTSTRENRYTSTSNPAYTAAVRISDEVWLEGTYEQGGATGAGAGEPNASGGSKAAFSAALDWRFHRNWSLRTEGGNASTAIDLLWHYRY
jgi:hypothetical protein